MPPRDAATRPEADAGEGRDPSFAGRVRALREAAGLTLRAAAARCGMAPSTLSKIENGLLSPTYDNLLRLARGLGVDIVALFRPDGAGSDAGADADALRFDVTRAGERPRQPAGVYAYEPMATRLASKRMDPTFVTVAARSLDEFAELVRHPGEEFVLVLSGAVEMHTDRRPPLRLEAGDSVYFDASVGHAYVSVGPEPATLLNVVAGGAGGPPLPPPPQEDDR